MTNSFLSAQKREEALKAAGQTSFDTETFAMQGLAIILAVIEQEVPASDGGGHEAAHHAKHNPFKAGGYGLQMLLDGIKGKESRGAAALKGLTKKANPYFTAHDVEKETESPVTQRYLTTRRWKKIGANSLQLLGELASLAGPPVNVPGAVLHGQAVGLTGMHLMGLAAIAHEYRNAATVAAWCKLLCTLKGAKLGVRGTQLAGVFVPAASLPASIVAACMKAGIKHLTPLGACYAAAAQIHWIAYGEQGHAVGLAVSTDAPAGRQAIARPGPAAAPINYSRPLPAPPGAARTTMPGAARTNFSRPLPAAPGAASPAPPAPGRRAPDIVPQGANAGPASRIFWEIFTRRGATRLLGAYEIDALIQEPAGWLALADKLILI